MRPRIASRKEVAMTNSKRRYRRNSERRVYVRGERHDPPDTYLLAHALLDLAAEIAAAKAETKAQPAASPDPERDAASQSENQP